MNSKSLSKASAIAQCKCPQCRKGNMFKSGPLNLKQFTEMNTDCSECGLHFEIEPGFFWGAMYVSYAITVLLMLLIGGIVFFTAGAKAGFWGYIIPIFLGMLLMMPFTFRYSRVLMIYWFSPIRYKGNETEL